MTSNEQRDPMAEVLAELSRIVLADEPLETILNRITHMAKKVIPAAAEVYARVRNAFDEEGADLARAFAGYAAVALHNAQVFAASRALAGQMEQAMESRAVIEQAKRILMGQRRVSADDAFDILRDLSQSSNPKLRDVAQAVVDMAQPETSPGRNPE